MRIWSIHPKYLDGKGLVALWRETLLARNVLAGKTRGYRNHPQLERFKAAADPVGTVDHYLSVVYREAAGRGYHFNKNKVRAKFPAAKMTVTRGQLNYERAHLLGKLKKRDPDKFRSLAAVGAVAPHPMFRAVKGDIENWEVVQ